MAPSLRVTGARRLLAVVTDTGAAGWGGDRPSQVCEQASYSAVLGIRFCTWGGGRCPLTELLRGFSEFPWVKHLLTAPPSEPSPPYSQWLFLGGSASPDPKPPEGRAGVSIQVAGSSCFTWDCPSFSTESLMSQEDPQDPANQKSWSPSSPFVYPSPTPSFVQLIPAYTSRPQRGWA